MPYVLSEADVYKIAFIVSKGWHREGNDQYTHPKGHHWQDTNQRDRPVWNTYFTLEQAYSYSYHEHPED